MTHKHFSQNQQSLNHVERKLIDDLRENNMQGLSSELGQLSHRESSSIFQQHLTRINHDLRTHGWLPGVKIAQSGDGFSVAPDGGNPGQGERTGDTSRMGRSGWPNPFAWQSQPPEEGPRSGGRNDQGAHDGRTVAGSSTKRDMVKILADEATKNGVDPATAVAAGLVESGLNPRKDGDYPTKIVHGKRKIVGPPESHGVYQLNKHGLGANLTPEEAYNPYVNAHIALSHFREVQDRNGNLSPGWLAAIAQNPKYKAKYAAEVNRLLPEARWLLGQI